MVMNLIVCRNLGIYVRLFPVQTADKGFAYAILCQASNVTSNAIEDLQQRYGFDYDEQRHILYKTTSRK